MDEHQPNPQQHLSAALIAHATDCAECRTVPLPLARLESLLCAVTTEDDAALLSEQVLRRLRPELERRAFAASWRRALIGVLVALVPLPLVLAYDAYLLRLVYGAISVLLPATVAAYLVASYAAGLVLLFALTYAAIPVLVVREQQREASALG